MQADSSGAAVVDGSLCPNSLRNGMIGTFRHQQTSRVTLSGHEPGRGSAFGISASLISRPKEIAMEDPPNGLS